MKQKIGKLVKILAWCIGVVLSILILLIIAIQIPYVQNRVKDFAINYVQDKIGTPVRLSRLEISFPTTIVVKDLYIESQQQDTLLAAQYIGVDISMFKLLSSTVKVSKIELDGLQANVKRDTLQRFNFDYIVEAFASEEEKEESSSTMKIDVGHIKLKNINLRFDDDYDGYHANVLLGSFATRFKEFDLDEMKFSIPNVELEKLGVVYRKDVAYGRREEVVVDKQNDEEIPSVLPAISLGNIKLSDIKIKYTDYDNFIAANVDLKEFLASFDVVDLATQQIDMKEFSLKKTLINVDFLANPNSKVKTQTTEPTVEQVVDTVSKPWHFGVKDFNLSEIALTYNDANEKKLTGGIDPNHIGINDLNVQLVDFQFSPSTITGNLKAFSFNEQSGFSIEEFSTYFLYGEQSSFVKNFYLQTPNTKIKTDIVLNYADINKLQDNLGDVSIDVNLRDTHIGLKDAYTLMPTLFADPNLAVLKNQELKIDTRLKGAVDNIVVDKFLVRGLNATFINVDGIIRELPDIDRATVDLTIKDFQTTARDIVSIAPKDVLPTTISIPALMQLKGHVKGGIQKLATDAKLYTSSGSINLEASIDQRVKGKEKYSITADVKELALGRIIQNDSIGTVSMSFTANGIGFNPDNINANADINVKKAEFNGYTYKDLVVKAAMQDSKYTVDFVNEDPNLQFAIQANGELTPNNLSLNMVVGIKAIKLQELHLDDKPTNISGLINVAMPNIMPDSLVGTVALNNLTFDVENDKYSFKPIVLSAEADTNFRKLSLTSSLVDFEMQGDYQLTQLGKAVGQSFASYFEKGDSSTPITNTEQLLKKGQYFDYSIEIQNNDLIQHIIPELKELSLIQFNGKYVQDTNYLSFEGGVPALKYGDIAISNIYVDLKPKDNKLLYSLGFDQLSNASIALNRVNLNGDIYNNILRYNFNLKDGNAKDIYRFAGEVQAGKDDLRINLDPRGFMLDYKEWIVDPDNRIVVNKDGFYIKDMALTFDTSFLKINSAFEQANSPLLIQFKDFELETLTTLVQKDKVLASGLLSGDLKMKDLNKDFRFITDINIQKLEVLEIPLGNLEVKVKNETQSQFLASVQLQGGENKLRLAGAIDADKKAMDLTLNLDKLQMKALEPFSMGNLSNSEGYLSGLMRINGTFTDPKILGGIDFNAIGLHVNPINADFKNINEQIAFTSRGIEFTKFSITDVDGNLLVIDGQVLTKNYQDFAFDMSIEAVDFKAVNSTVKDNDMYYGTLVFDANVKIKGDLDKPIVTGGIEIGKKTTFTVVMPQEDPSIADREGIVEFVDQESLRMAALKRYEEDFNTSKLKGMDVTMSIKVDKEAAFAMVMDKVSGDKVVIEGNGDLVGGIDASGKMTLTGRYEFTKGSYDLSFNFLKRKFIVQPGSSIVWMGEPTSAKLDLTAIYETNTSPSDLLASQLSAMSPTQQNMYKQRLPFQALLMMKGELLQPEISFDIKLKEGITSVSGDVISNTNSRLEQIRANETELNKQVFSLLLLNRFIGENPFDASLGGLSAGQMARQSVSRLLSDQLNNFASNLIQGVELNFNLDSSEDFSSGTSSTRTDLNLAVSKRMFSDRLKVTVGSSFEVEGEQRANEQATNIAGDIELEYALSKDGRYLLRVYRKNTYEVALQGQIVETGVGFVITMSYDKFKELFERSKDKKELKNKLKDASK